MLILEGSDMLGKTTLMPFLEKLARERCARIGVPYMGRCEKFGLDESKYTTAEEWIARIKPWTICDRFAMSEMMYGEEARGKPNITEEMYELVDEKVVESGGKVVVLVGTEEWYEELIRTVYPTRGEAFSPEICRRVNRRYAEMREGVDCDLKIVLDGKTGYAHERGPLGLASVVGAWVEEQVRYTRGR